MRVLIACEFSGVVRDAFASRGHDAMSCDLESTEIPASGNSTHYRGDVFGLLEFAKRKGWMFDLLIAHPPCTYLCNSGVRWLRGDLKRQIALDDAGEFFRLLLESPIARICVENPIPHKYALQRIGRKYDQLIQPWQFGHGETKATCLWLKNLPKLVPTDIVSGREARIHKMPPSENRSRDRSRTYPGIAAAMAEQWV